MQKRVLIIQNVKANHHHVSYLDGLARALDRAKFEPIVVLQAGVDITEGYPPPNYELHLLPGATYSVPGQAQFMAAAMNLLDGMEGVDIIHCSNPFSSVLPALLHKKLRGASCKVIYDMRGLWVEFAVHSGSFPPAFAKVIDAIDVAALHASDGVIAISPKLKEVLITKKGVPAEKVSVVPGGASLDQFRNAAPFDYRSLGWQGKVFGYVSSISKLRNSQDVIEAFDMVQRAVSVPVYLAMVGPVYEPEFFTDYVRERGLEGKVKFFGQVPHREVPAYVKGCDVVVSYFPDEDHIFHQVSQPYKVIEYFAAGRPTVLSEQICHRNIANDGVDSLFVGPTPAALAGGMLALLGDTPLAARLAAGALETADRYSFGAVARLAEAAYERSLRA